MSVISHKNKNGKWLHLKGWPLGLFVGFFCFGVGASFRQGSHPGKGNTVYKAQRLETAQGSVGKGAFPCVTTALFRGAASQRHGSTALPPGPGSQGAARQPRGAVLPNHRLPTRSIKGKGAGTADK